MKSLTMIVIGVLAPAAVSGCALSNSDEESSDGESDIQQGLVDGTIDTNHPFDVGVCTGGLVPEGQPNAGTCAAIRCSGTLIAPNVVLTARHCVKAHVDAPSFCDGFYTDDPITPNPFYVTTSPSVASGNPRWYAVERVEVPAATALCTEDIALLFLKHDIPRHEARPVGINVRRDLAKRPPHEVAVVGRGVLGENIFTGAGDNGGFERRIRTHIPFDCATDDPAHPCEVVDFSSPPTNTFTPPTAHFVIDASVVSGDSGAGVFDQAHFKRRSPNVIGIVAADTFGEDGNPNFGLISRIDTHADFIRAALDGCGANLIDSDDD